MHNLVADEKNAQRGEERTAYAKVREAKIRVSTQVLAIDTLSNSIRKWSVSIY